jgi:hypothetical protein
MGDHSISYRRTGCSMVTSHPRTLQGLLVRIPTEQLTIPTASEVGHGNWA